MAADIWTFPPSVESLQFLLGYRVVATDGRVGTIDEHSLASDSSYLVVDTGWWIFERKRLIPCGLIRNVKRAPVFRPIEHSSESGRYNDFYGSL